MANVLMVYLEGKFKALTLSYDDGVQADKRLIGLLNRHGLKGTFHINGGLFKSSNRIPAEEIAEVYKGHEVSAHSLNHPTIARCPKEQLVYEMMEDRKTLEQLVGYPVRGMSYPNGSHNNLIRSMLPFLGVEYGRVTQGTGGFGLPDDWYEWKPTCHHKQNLLELTDTFTGLHKSQYLFLMYVWGHSYEFDNDNNWELIETFCERVGGRNDIWYATNIEIYDYIQAFRRLQFSAARSFVYNPSAQPVWIKADGRIVRVDGGTQVQLDG